MKKSKLVLPFTALALLLPMTASAQSFFYVQNWISAIRSFASQAVGIVMIALTLWFLISVFRYVAEKDPGKLADRRKTMIASLVGLFIAVSVWGIIRLAGTILGTNNIYDQGNICPPTMTNVNGKCI